MLPYSQSQSTLLSLPPELTLDILARLPLSALFIWHFQLCKQLRLASSSGYGLELHKAYWSLAEHRQAAREVRQLCLPLSTVNAQQQQQQQQQQQSKGTSASVIDGPGTSPDADATLALRALRYVGLVRHTSTPHDLTTNSSLPLPPPRLSKPPTSLSLIGSRGVDGRLLRQLLHEPGLACVKTVVKTGRRDKRK